MYQVTLLKCVQELHFHAEKFSVLIYDTENGPETTLSYLMNEFVSLGNKPLLNRVHLGHRN